MSSYNFILNEFGLQGLQPKYYDLEEEGSSQDSFADLGQISIEEIDGPISYLGTAVFSRLVLEDEDSDLSIDLDSVLLQVSQTKNIVTTSINGRDGTIKEYVSAGDYQVSIKGAIVEPINANIYPRAKVKTLVDLISLPRSLICISGYLSLFGITNLVIQSYNFPQSEGFQNRQLFEIEAISDTNIQLLLG